MSCIIIAEAGVNHNGSLQIAKQLIDGALKANVDYIKFQTFRAERLATNAAMKAKYQEASSGIEENQQQMLRKLELSFEEFRNIAEYCKQVGIGFLSTPFDSESISFLEGLGMSLWKIPSGEITNYPYLVQIAQTHKPVILSTGMSTIAEVSDAISVLNESGSGPITLLHCTSEYPAPFNEANLMAIQTMREKFKIPVGYSDHTEGIVIPIAAAAMGAVVIEKHFTLDRTMEGPDHKASLELNELKKMVEAIRIVESALGNGIKQPTELEKKNIVISRKSIVANRAITQGELFSTENITTKRPGNGLSPMKWKDVLGKIAKRSFVEDEIIEL